MVYECYGARRKLTFLGSKCSRWPSPLTTKKDSSCCTCPRANVFASGADTDPRDRPEADTAVTNKKTMRVLMLFSTIRSNFVSSTHCHRVASVVYNTMSSKKWQPLNTMANRVNRRSDELYISYYSRYLSRVVSEFVSSSELC